MVDNGGVQRMGMSRSDGKRSFCAKSINIGNGGRYSLDSHVKSATHKNNMSAKHNSQLRRMMAMIVSLTYSSGIQLTFYGYCFLSGLICISLFFMYVINRQLQLDQLCQDLFECLAHEPPHSFLKRVLA